MEVLRGIRWIRVWMPDYNTPIRRANKLDSPIKCVSQNRDLLKLIPLAYSTLLTLDPTLLSLAVKLRKSKTKFAPTFTRSAVHWPVGPSPSSRNARSMNRSA
ncbi:hypothetical protein GP486_003786 [Trichoglossum hirsutum]|uniref:Uncharacterized protein n=1 Tax=Trichoglossum hirsutum TaxID=265104 RepID=A0A9P8LCG8_9PEZI|nr:hypothetical protein GP486_003786 [Trichoglossum hirsutum]